MQTSRLETQMLLFPDCDVIVTQWWTVSVRVFFLSRNLWAQETLPVKTGTHIATESFLFSQIHNFWQKYLNPTFLKRSSPALTRDAWKSIRLQSSQHISCEERSASRCGEQSVWKILAREEESREPSFHGKRWERCRVGLATNPLLRVQFFSKYGVNSVFVHMCYFWGTWPVSADRRTQTDIPPFLLDFKLWKFQKIQFTGHKTVQDLIPVYNLTEVKENLRV